MEERRQLRKRDAIANSFDRCYTVLTAANYGIKITFELVSTDTLFCPIGTLKVWKQNCFDEEDPGRETYLRP